MPLTLIQLHLSDSLGPVLPSPGLRLWHALKRVNSPRSSLSDQRISPNPREPLLLDQLMLRVHRGNSGGHKGSRKTGEGQRIALLFADNEGQSQKAER